MKILHNTLRAVVETWQDPGDYPNALAQGPLPDRKYLAGVDGKLVVELTYNEMLKLIEFGWDWFLSNETEGVPLPDGVADVTWQVEAVTVTPGSLHAAYCVALSCFDATPDPNYHGPEPPDHRED
jgi:hypothetical protein